MITSTNIAGHELVGLYARVMSSPCAGIIGLNGGIIDETKSMVSIRTSGGVKQVPKAHTTFEIGPVGGTTVSLDGSRILGRPHARLGARR